MNSKRTSFFVLFLSLIMACSVPCSAQDRDGDGHISDRQGGDDCNDNDPNRYPGNFEICDADHHDEDCNPMTYGSRDEDGDGLIDVRCCNRASNNRLYCGNDCDDSNRAIQIDSQVCDGRQVAICGSDGTYIRVACPNGTSCVVQPNGTGVCIVPPPGYIAPPLLSPARASSLQRRPVNRPDSKKVLKRPVLTK